MAAQKTPSAPTSREEWTGGGVSIANGEGDWLTWQSSGGPDTVLDTSVPAHPTIIAAGVYMVSVAVNCGSMSTAGRFAAGLFLDRTGFNASIYATSSTAGDELGGVNGRVSDVALAFAWYLPVGAQIGVFVDNFDGSLTTVFSLVIAHVQRLS